MQAICYYAWRIPSNVSTLGGLQIITRGLQNTPEVRDKVYTNQGTYADIGMAFDEIPVKATQDGKSSKIDTKRRFFDRENFDTYATQTGKNVRAQIEKFIELKSNCRPLLLCMGHRIKPINTGQKQFFEKFQSHYMIESVVLLWGQQPWAWGN